MINKETEQNTVLQKKDKEASTQKQCKIYIINSSPRKGRNTDEMCKSFKKVLKMQAERVK